MSCVIIVDIRVDKLLWTQLIALEQVHPARVAEWPLRHGFAAPHRCGGDVTVETGFFRSAWVGGAAEGTQRGSGGVGCGRGWGSGEAVRGWERG
jgi:hypothetical protein